MWKHNNFINLQLYAPPPSITFVIYVNGEYTSIAAGSSNFTWKENYEYFGSWATTSLPEYTLTDTNVVWEDGTILQYDGVDVLPTDTMISEGQYTTRSNGGGVVL